MTEMPTLRPGDTGDGVGLLHQRLAVVGWRISESSYDSATEQAVREFQEARGLRPDGICGPEVWQELDDASWRLGDRLLCFRRPMLRGDDVAELQERLNRLGFDAGREDGILGERTADALRDFQRNAGLAGDGIAGKQTVAAIRVLGSFAQGSLAMVRERESLRSRTTIQDMNILLATASELRGVALELEKYLQSAGAAPLLHSDGEEHAAAQLANDRGVSLALLMRTGDEAAAVFYTSGRFRSEIGWALAGEVVGALARISEDADAVLQGRAYPFVRETQMPAVVIEIPGDEHPGLGTVIGEAVVQAYAKAI